MDSLREEIMKVKKLDIVDVKRMKTYSVSTILLFILTIIEVAAALIFVALPLHKVFLTIACSMVILITFIDLVTELIKPELHYHWWLQIPENFDGWKGLFLITKCIDYKAEDNIAIVEFLDEEMVRRAIEEIME